MKEAKRYSITVTTSRAGNPNYKFSEYALHFLEAKLAELKENEAEFNKIRATYKNRNKLEATLHEQPT